MSRRFMILAGLVVPVVALAQPPAPKPFALGDIFIDSNGDTLQITQCQGAGWAAECQVKRLAASGKAPIDPSGRWWSVDTLRGSEKYWISNGGAAYAGPKVALNLPAAQTPARTPAAPAVPAVPAAPQRAAAVAPPAAPQTGKACPKTAYSGQTPGRLPASEALFRQKVADSITMGTYGQGWYGVILETFSVGAPITNVVTNVPGVGATRVNSAAPPNAKLYPVSTRMTVCEGWAGGSGSWRTSQKKYQCFVSRDNLWICGASS